jgi:hypothetical protein
VNDLCQVIQEVKEVGVVIVAVSWTLDPNADINLGPKVVIYPRIHS